MAHFTRITRDGGPAVIKTAEFFLPGTTYDNYEGKRKARNTWFVASTARLPQVQRGISPPSTNRRASPTLCYAGAAGWMENCGCGGPGGRVRWPQRTPSPSPRAPYISVPAPKPPCRRSFLGAPGPRIPVCAHVNPQQPPPFAFCFSFVLRTPPPPFPGSSSDTPRTENYAKTSQLASPPRNTRGIGGRWLYSCVCVHCPRFQHDARTRIGAFVVIRVSDESVVRVRSPNVPQAKASKLCACTSYPLSRVAVPPRLGLARAHAPDVWVWLALPPATSTRLLFPPLGLARLPIPIAGESLCSSTHVPIPITAATRDPLVGVSGPSYNTLFLSRPTRALSSYFPPLYHYRRRFGDFDTFDSSGPTKGTRFPAHTYQNDTKNEDEEGSFALHDPVTRSILSLSNPKTRASGTTASSQTP